MHRAHCVILGLKIANSVKTAQALFTLILVINVSRNVQIPHMEILLTTCVNNVTKVASYVPQHQTALVHHVAPP